MLCILSSGTAEERGIAAWRKLEQESEEANLVPAFSEGYEVYEPVLPNFLKKSKYMKYFPIFPSYKSS